MNLKTHYDTLFFKDKKIIKCNSLSTAFGSFCEKVQLQDNTVVVTKRLIQNNNNYDSIYYEGKCLEFMNHRFPALFPKVLYLKDNFLIMEYIIHNNIKNNISEKDFAYQLSRIHRIKSDQFGFHFDPPIGGIRQPSNLQKSWVEFYGNDRLGMIYELINSTNPMPKEINKGIEKIMKNLINIIPNNPRPSLIHGDLWEGNILFHNGNLRGLIDPGIYYAHSEMEISYLEFFKYISKDFYEYYAEYHYLDKEYFNYSKVYQLYYCLLNVHLWSRNYIQNTAELIKKLV